MKVKITNPATAAGLKDPHTRRSPFIHPETGEVILEADVPETSHWTRRLMAGEVTRVVDADAPAPTGNEPIASLTTRGGK